MTLFYREDDSGNIEYKLSLEKMSKDKFERYSTQMKYSIIEGKGKAIYLIGVNDFGEIIGLNNSQINYSEKVVNAICSNIDCKIKLILKCKFKNLRFLIFIVRSKFKVENLPFVI